MNSSESRSRPIGIFDSGVGGLTVLKAIRNALPAEDLVYLGDTARLPYGTKSPASIARYASQAMQLLKDKGIKLLVVACNTASAVALDALAVEMAPLPVIGVVDPGAKAAISGRQGAAHLVLATETTVRLGAYRKAILARDPDAMITELACEMLVAVAEEGWTDGNIPRDIVRRYLGHLDGQVRHPDCLILGCTHFPILRDAIADVVGPGTAIVDSASTTALAVSEMIDEKGIRNSEGRTGSLTLLATDGAARFARVGGRFLGENLAAGDIHLVDL